MDVYCSLCTTAISALIVLLPNRPLLSAVRPLGYTLIAYGFFRTFEAMFAQIASTNVFHYVNIVVVVTVVVISFANLMSFVGSRADLRDDVLWNR